MRSLATSLYTATQVETVLRSGHASYSARFELLNQTLGPLGELDTVIAATVEWNVDRAYKASLELDLLPHPQLGDAYSALIKPWFRILMPDGGYAEYAQGVYLWEGAPERRLGEAAEPTWTATCASLEQWLDDAGPGPAGFTIAAGTAWTTAIAQIIGLAGLTDTTGITTSSATATAGLTWDVSDGTFRLTTWRTILNQIHDTLGYYSGWFDADGRYIAQPQPDFTTAAVGIRYGASEQGVTIIPATTGQLLARRANRIIAIGQAGDGTTASAVADADVLHPTHPWRKGAIGRYIDFPLYLAATDAATLTSAATAELARRLSSYQTLQVQALAWPVHEMFDVVEIQWDGDAEFDVAQRFHERRWTLDLMTGVMRHDLRRIA